MLTEKSQETPAPSVHHAPAPAALDELICYFEGDWVPMRDAKVSIMTHAFMYGTATFEGIRAYWNEEQGQLYGLKIREHVERIRQSCRILLMKNVPSVDELTRLVVETVRRNGFRQDAYIRPSFYKSTRAIGVRLHDLENELYIIALPFGNYIDTEAGRPGHDVELAAQRRRGAAGPRQDRRRVRQHGLPEVGGRAQRLRRGDRADGRWPRQRGVGGERVRRPRRVAFTPPVSDDLLEGVTRKALIELLAHEGIPLEVRSIDRSELYVADEMFLCGTGVQISPVIEIDHRPVGSGEVGPIGRLVRDRYFDAVRGRLPEYSHWLTPIG